MKNIKKTHIILALILFLTFVLRFPSLFEPFWYGDEGIFAAVARNLNFGGVLYEDAWDNKPPMIYLTYQAIFNVFGVSMFWLRLVTVIVVMTTAAIIYEIGQKVLSQKRALWAALVFGILSSLRVIEGNLSLTEIFMLLPMSLAMMIVILRKFDLVSLFVAGFLLAVASLYKQVGALEAVALGIFLFLKEPKFSDFFKKGLVLTFGFLVPFVISFVYFAPKGLVGEFIFAAYTYYQIYFEESPQRAILINILKFLPIGSALAYGLWKKRSSLAVDNFHLILLWCAFSFLGAYFSGRTYGHYLVQAAPAVSLLVAAVSLNFRLKREQFIFALLFFLPLIFLTKLLFNDFFVRAHVNQISYWRNFIEYLNGKKEISVYSNYFDSQVNTIAASADFFQVNNALGTTAYIWGDWPWLYATGDLKNPSRYVTSFHVFGVPNGKEEVINDLLANPPEYIIKPPSSIGYFAEFEKFVARGYTRVLAIDSATIFKRVD